MIAAIYTRKSTEHKVRFLIREFCEARDRAGMVSTLLTSMFLHPRVIADRERPIVTIFVTRLCGKGKERTGKDRTNRTLQANEIATNLGEPLQ
jgi:hypothetical protein